MLKSPDVDESFPVVFIQHRLPGLSHLLPRFPGNLLDFVFAESFLTEVKDGASDRKDVSDIASDPLGELDVVEERRTHDEGGNRRLLGE